MPFVLIVPSTTWKTKVAAARDAGYAPSTALKKSYAMVDRQSSRSSDGLAWSALEHKAAA